MHFLAYCAFHYAVSPQIMLKILLLYGIMLHCANLCLIRGWLPLGVWADGTVLEIFCEMKLMSLLNLT